jgi:acetylglutamate kinase
MKELTIIKIGGAIIDDEIALKKFIGNFIKINGPKLLVHGGGKMATELSDKLGVKIKMHQGRRITDADTLKITCMVYAGWINKNITALLNAQGNPAIGLCGADLSILSSVKRNTEPIDFGFVGDVVEKNINIKQLSYFLEQHITPVIAPITSDLTGQLLNTNADTVASVLATALSRNYNVKLVYCFEKNGVLNNSKLLETINQEEFIALKKNNMITDGMIPKLDNAFDALEKGVDQIMIGHAANINQLIQNHGGTRITKN